MSRENLIIYRDKVAAEACCCARCPDCNGTGSLWVTLDGKYHTHRCDDLGDLEMCEECGGSGISHECGRCIELNDLDRDEDERQ